MDLSLHWKTIIDTLKEGLVVVGPDGTIAAVNPAAEALTGYSADEMIGRSCRMLDCTGCVIYGLGSGEKWCKLFQDGMVKAKKCLITSKDHHSVTVLKNATVLRDNEGRVIGAVETLTDISEIVRQQEEILALRKTLDLDDNYFGILGKSLPMQRLFEMIQSVSQSDTPVMIYGQSGTGKEMVARAIHWASPRECKPFIKVNCAALNENLLESELFGYKKGAFTGATTDKKGLITMADQGTLFLDEIGDMPLGLQAKILKVIETGEVLPVGDVKPIHADVRIVAATNKNLEEQISKGLFREDLYYRLNVIEVKIPPLRERKEDISVLARHFVEKYSKENNKKVSGISDEAMEILYGYPWPGNIRELRNVIERAVVLASAEKIEMSDLPERIRTQQGAKTSHSLKDRMEYYESKIVKETLEAHSWNKEEVARALDVDLATLYRKIEKLGIAEN